MSPAKCLMSAVLLSTGAIPVALASDASTSAMTTPSPAQAAANEDFGLLSRQGSTAFRDIRLTRIAIFNGQIGQAQRYLGDASTALQKARADASAYTKAESDLTPPPGVEQRKGGNEESSGPVRWLPVDGALAVDENFAASPDKKAGMAKADTQLKSGDRKGALETLRLAGVDVTFDLEVVPIEKTIEAVQNAKTMMASGLYYEANQALKSVEDGARFDVESYASTAPATHHAVAASGAATTRGGG
ncbi:YfdX family protein [Rhizosaccharibacter radicis]|uniref:YfdX family protein n=1 Tax=Rhizosaccharibacter radicis TaxID=2782605 RepID=A0ABT1VWZ1_9PROT|nr:YfdX family protein [Acetobacteraceae bacterium KSS12]